MLIAHLAKEWREQRWVLLVLVALMAALAGAAWLLLDPLERGIVPVWLFHTGVIVGIVVLTSELVPGEMRRDQLRWLLRLPGALAPAFVAKWLLLVAGTFGLATAGAAFGIGVEGLAPGVDASTPGDRFLRSLALEQGLLLLGACAAFTPWAFAVSCWMPRSMLVVPAALILLAPVFVGLPALARSRPGMPLLVLPTWPLIAWVGGAGLLVAWRSFRHGLRQGRDGLLKQGALAVGLLMPIGVGAAVEVHAWHHVDPCDPRTSLLDGQLGAGGRLAFLFVQDGRWPHYNPYYSVVVDLKTGAAWQHGAPMSQFGPAAWLDQGDAMEGEPGGHEFVAWRRPDPAHGGWQYELIDGRTGAVLHSGDPRAMPGSLATRLRSARIATAQLRDASGMAVFDRGGRWYRAAGPDGAHEPYASKPRRAGWMAGLAVRLFDSKDAWNEYFDPLLGVTVSFARGESALRLASGWMVRAQEFPVGRRWRWRWNLQEPISGARRPLAIEPTLEVGPLLDEMSILLLDRDSGRLERFVPSTGQHTPIAIDGGPWLSPTHVYAGRSTTRSALVRSPDGATVLLVSFAPPHTQALGKLRGDRILLTDCASSLTLLGFLDADSALAIVDHKRIERLRFGGGRDVLFPR